MVLCWQRHGRVGRCRVLLLARRRAANRSDAFDSSDRAGGRFFVDMNTEGVIISASMALEMRCRTIRILSGTFQSASRAAGSSEIQKREEVKPNE